MTNLRVAFKTWTWSGTSHFCSRFFGQVSWTHLTLRGWESAILPRAWGSGRQTTAHKPHAAREPWFAALLTNEFANHWPGEKN